MTPFHVQKKRSKKGIGRRLRTNGARNGRLGVGLTSHASLYLFHNIELQNLSNKGETKDFVPLVIVGNANDEIGS